MAVPQPTSLPTMRLILTREEFLAAQSRPKERVRKWIAFADELPPEGVLVDTRIDDMHGVRMAQPLMLSQRMLWTKEGDYVYYQPTHWAKREIEMYVSIEISSCTIQNLFVG